MPQAMLRYILTLELRHAVSLVHHESDQLCIFRPSLAAREQAIREGARLYYFSGSDALGNGGHSHGHFVESEGSRRNFSRSGRVISRPSTDLTNAWEASGSRRRHPLKMLGLRDQAEGQPSRKSFE